MNEEKTSKAAPGKSCRVKGCKRPYRAKGYCNVHYHKWRNGEMPKARYRTCCHGSRKRKRGEKKECLKPVFRRGLCEEHYKAAYQTAKNQAAAPAPAAEPAS